MKIEKVKKLVNNLHDKNEYVLHIRNSKQAGSKSLINFEVSSEWLNLTKMLG